MLPYYSRRIGLVSGREVPILAGGKVNGRVSGTNVGAQIVQTSDVDGVAPDATMGVVRVKQNVLAESSVGLIATAGDPRGRAGSWLVGGDATYQTSRMKGTRTSSSASGASRWAATASAPIRAPTASASTIPNDLWDTVVKYWRVGQDFDPSLGFVARPGVHAYAFRTEYKPRPDFWNIRQMFFEFRNSLVTDLDGRWESYRVFTAPVNWRFESGDRAEFNWIADRRAPRRALRGVAGRRHSARLVPLDAVPPRGRNRLEAPLQQPVHVVVRRLLRGHAAPAHLDRRVEPRAARDRRVGRRVQRRAASTPATSTTRWPARGCA